jgi:hypothetical protein
VFPNLRRHNDFSSCLPGVARCGDISSDIAFASLVLKTQAAQHSSSATLWRLSHQLVDPQRLATSSRALQPLVS